MGTLVKVLVVLALSCFVAAPQGTSVISLAGRWRFELDRDGVGVAQRWFERSLPGAMTLPGSLPAQGVGDDVSVNTQWTGSIVDRSWYTAPQYGKYRRPGNVKVPFWLQPAKHYTGSAWYQRDIEIPSDWKDKRVALTLERAHWETEVWIDATRVGSNDSLSTPHEYDLGSVAPGRHRLTIRVANGLVIDIGENSHGISDHTQGDWNGIVGRIELRATSPVWIEDLRVTPNVAGKTVLVDVQVGKSAGSAGSGTIRIWKGLSKASSTPDATARIAWDGSRDSRTKLEVKLGDEVPTWDEFSPALQHLIVELDGDSARDTRRVAFGQREISTAGTQFTMNGRPIFLRGTLECSIFPRTGHPPTEIAEWKRIMSVAKAFGLNLLRFHSYCPPKAAFDAADELGMYLQVETCWPNQSTTLGDGKPVDQWVYTETDRILKAYGNHPSFILMPSGNEPGGKNASAYLAKWVEHYKTLDPRRLFTAGSGWPQLPENQFHVLPQPRIQAWGEGLKSRINTRPPETETDYRDYISKRAVPVISHEIGQWCVYPDFDEIPKYTGYLKPKNFDIFRAFLVEHHMGDQARQFLLASGKLQTLCYKEDIESALRTPGMGGFELLDLHDFPGQGTALVGVLNPFWEEKGYVTAEEYRRFCSATVPLARLAKRVFTTGETLEAGIEVAHFGPAPLRGASAAWKLTDSRGGEVAVGSLPARDITTGSGIPLGRISIALHGIQAPQHCRLTVSLDKFRNDWDVWVYPERLSPDPSGVVVAEELDDRARTGLSAGRKVLLLVPPKRVKNDAQTPVVLGFSSIFWNTAWTRRQAPTTLGILCDPRNPAFADFPTDFHSDWQWWYLVTRAAPMILDPLPPELRPTVQVIDDWFTARRLGLVFEARVGKGSLMVCSIVLDDANPVARQFRHSLLRYMAGAGFHPQQELDLSSIESLFTR